MRLRTSSSLRHTSVAAVAALAVLGVGASASAKTVIGQPCTLATDCKDGKVTHACSDVPGLGKRCGLAPGADCSGSKQTQCASGSCASTPLGMRCCGGVTSGGTCSTNYQCSSCWCNAPGGDLCCDANMVACGAGASRSCCPAQNCCPRSGTGTNYDQNGAGCLGTPEHCGACGNRCTAPANAVPSCVNGSCTFTCNAGYVRCGSSCVAIDDQNCGACGLACGAGRTCQNTGTSLAPNFKCLCDDAACAVAGGCCSSSAGNAVKDLCISSGGLPACPSCTLPQACGGVACGLDPKRMRWMGEAGACAPDVGTSEVDLRCNGTLYAAVSAPTAGQFTLSVSARTVSDTQGACGGGSAVLIGRIYDAQMHRLFETSWTVANTSFPSTPFQATTALPAGTLVIGLAYANACGNRVLAIESANIGPADLATSDSFGVCNAACVDLSNDRFNCGTCGTRCLDGDLCVNGACTSSACLAAIPGNPGDRIALETPTTEAACHLNATSVAQSALDSQRGEDQQFFVQEQTAPSMLIVVDTGVSMRRLPVDPACGATRGCESSFVDAIFDKVQNPTAGGSPPDPAFSSLFSPDAYYVGSGDAVNLGGDCASVDRNSVFSASNLEGACARAGVALADTASCVQCLVRKGYYVDGLNRIWQGRFLNLYPPKCVEARKLLKSSTLVAQSQVRFSLAFTQDAARNASPPVVLDMRLSGFNPNQCQPPGRVKPAYLNQLDNQLSFNTESKPLAEALFNAGQYVQNEGRFYLTTFGADWTARTQDLNNPALDANKSAVCSECQKSSIVVITDGTPCQDNVLPKTNTALAAYSPVDANQECKTEARGCYSWCDPTTPNWASAVSALLNNSDLRTDWPGIQSAQTYVIGFGVDNPLLRSVAGRGGGEYYTVYNGRQLEDALRSVISSVSRRAIGVATPSLSTLQTKSGSTALIPRFVPNKKAAWPGELYKFNVFSEFAEGCREPGQVVRTESMGEVTCVCNKDKNDPSAPARCDGMYFLDAANRFVSIDPTDGRMVRVDPTDRDEYGVPRVPADAESAVPVWAAGALLGTTAPTSRTLFTVVDTNGDGRIDSNDEPIDLRADLDDDSLLKLIPYMGLGISRLFNPGDARVCDLLLTHIRNGGVPLTSSQFNERLCARVILAWLQGYDVANESGTPLTADQVSDYQPQSMPARPYKLGDIFHSSPVRVEPAIPKFPLCDRGFNNQCVRTLYWPEEKLDRASDQRCGVPEDAAEDMDAYERYYYAKTFVEKRPPIVLAGSNGGLLHAFQLSCFHHMDAVTRRPIYYERSGGSDTCQGTSHDNGTELWGFMPPDLLAKAGELLVGTRHPYMVDGTPLVRDVWVDVNNDGKKTCDEYRTVAILGERRGGNHYTALDISDVQQPKFLWMFPQPGSADELVMGETWSDHLPTPPPIGPVLLSSADPQRPEERWVVMLGGGYDPRRIRGNRLFMLDVYTGEKVWEARPVVGTSTEAMQHPIAAMPSLVAWGSGASTASFDFNGGYFDTAVVGDVGGQVWVARFHEPGVFGTNARGERVVTNWTIARGFQLSRDDGAGVLARPPLFAMPGLVRMPSSGELRAYLGTGDRYNLRQPDLGECNLDDPLACLRNDVGPFTSTTQSTYRVGGSTFTVSWQLDANGAFERSEALSWNDGQTCAAAGADPIQIGVAASIGTCDTPSTGCSGAFVSASQVTTGATDAAYACHRDSRGVLTCDGDVIPSGAVPISTTPAAADAKASAHPEWFNRFIAFRVFGGEPFRTSDQARSYDSHRLTETDLLQMTPYDAPAVVASESDKGFYLSYPALEEKTATNMTIFNGCAVWSTVQPNSPCTSSNAGTACDGGSCVGGACYQQHGQCTPAGGSVYSYLYQANAVTGAPTCALTSNTTRRTESRVVVPPPPPQEVVQVNAYGQYKTAIAAPPGGAAPPASAQSLNMLRQFYMSEIPRNVHECRHVRADEAVCE